MEILSRVIIEDASREAKAILDKANIEYAFIREEGIQKAEALKKAVKDSKSQADLLYNQAKIVSLAEFSARKDILERKEEVLKGILRQIREEFFLLPERTDYPEILKRLIIHALRHLKGKRQQMRCMAAECIFGKV